mmetsp:Transcript_11659/g.30157  ORF Transcript_11659/g.30157 Transcript_11659/m.30157 type:complete len:238 (-) Transcript_11659:89-802(-)
MQLAHAQTTPRNIRMGKGIPRKEGSFLLNPKNPTKLLLLPPNTSSPAAPRIFFLPPALSASPVAAAGAGPAESVALPPPAAGVAVALPPEPASSSPWKKRGACLGASFAASSAIVPRMPPPCSAPPWDWTVASLSPEGRVRSPARACERASCMIPDAVSIRLWAEAARSLVVRSCWLCMKSGMSFRPLTASSLCCGCCSPPRWRPPASATSAAAPMQVPSRVTARVWRERVAERAVP